MTARLILCPDTAAALDRLNDIRELDARIAKAGRKAAKTGDTSEVHTLNDERAWLAMTLADHLLKGACYTDSEPDPRVAALEARVEAYKQGWDALGPFCTKQFRGDDPSITDEELHAFCVARRTIWELEHGDTLPAQEASEYVASGPLSSGSVDLHGGKPIRKGER